MKNIFEILKSAGLDVPEDKKGDVEKEFKENYAPVAELEKVRTARDNYKTQLETAQKSLKEFEGVDVGELQGKITTLTENLANQEKEFQQKISDMEFDAVIESAITSSHAKNAKAVRALLDEKALKSSKNQKEDIKTAIDQIKEENDYLFESDEPYSRSKAVEKTGGGQQAKSVEEMSKMTFDEYKAYRNQS